MIDQINTLIEINLLQLFTSENNSLNLKNFKDNLGNKLQGAQILADIMLQKELIQPKPGEDFTYELTPHGRQVMKTGGWEEHLKRLKKTELKNKTTETIEPEVASKKFNIELFIALLILFYLCYLIVSCVA